MLQSRLFVRKNRTIATLLTLLLTLSPLLLSCSGDELPEPQEVIVVEGWIDDGGFPVVILSKNLPVSSERTSLDDLSDRLIRWAKVSVVCEGDTTILTGMVRDTYFPPYIYTTSRMRGASGKTYQLIVDYHDYHVTAVTTIPPRPIVDSITVSTAEHSDTLYKVNLYFQDNPDERNFYKAFVRIGTRSQQFRPCYLGTVSDAVLQSHNNKLPIYRGSLLTDKDLHTPYFTPSDTILLKFAQLDEVSYRFWNDYESYTSFANNPMFPVASNLPTNIHGGIGYWCGYGSIMRSLTFRPAK